MKELASVKNLMILGILNERYWFTSKEDALKKLSEIREVLVVSKKTEERGLEDSLILWVKGYVDESEASEGYIGNFIHIQIKPVGSLFVLYAVKDEIPLKYHPQKGQPINSPYPNPNWANPILKKIRNGKIYDNRIDIIDDFKMLEEKYPKPKTERYQNEMKILVYEFNTNIEGVIEQGVKRYFLRIEEIDVNNQTKYRVQINNDRKEDY